MYANLTVNYCGATSSALTAVAGSDFGSELTPARTEEVFRELTAMQELIDRASNRCLFDNRQLPTVFLVSDNIITVHMSFPMNSDLEDIISTSEDLARRLKNRLSANCCKVLNEKSLIVDTEIGVRICTAKNWSFWEYFGADYKSKSILRTALISTPVLGFLIYIFMKIGVFEEWFNIVLSVAGILFLQLLGAGASTLSNLKRLFVVIK